MDKQQLRIKWQPILIGAATATATALVLQVKPKDPKFTVVSISLTSFKLNFPVLDAELILKVKVDNPNVAPIHYSPSTMSIFYDGCFIGSGEVHAGSQARNSCQVLKIPARLDGLELAHHVKKLLSDVAKREMVLDASVDIEGAARVLWWDHKFKIHVDSHIIVDPVFLDVIEQENKSELEICVT